MIPEKTTTMAHDVEGEVRFTTLKPPE